MHVPALRTTTVRRVNGVERDAEFRQVTEKVVEQDLRRQKGQEWQEERRHGHREHVAEIGPGTHANIFQYVRERRPARK
jgi:hypothetical protein